MRCWRVLVQWLPLAIAGCAQQPADSGVSPRLLLADIYWAFTGETYSSVDEFKKGVSDYHESLNIESKWRPDEIAIEEPSLRVLYVYWEGDEQLDATVDLVADDGQRFSTAELIFKLHNAVVHRLRDHDAVFFEGLIFEPSAKDASATCTLQLGS